MYVCTNFKHTSQQQQLHALVGYIDVGLLGDKCREVNGNKIRPIDKIRHSIFPAKNSSQ